MARPLGEARWEALRALREGESPTFMRLAAVSGMHVSTIRERAGRDNWAKRDFSPRKMAEEARAAAEARIVRDNPDAARGKARDDFFPAAARDESAPVATALAGSAALMDLMESKRPAPGAGEPAEAFLVDEVEEILAEARAGKVDKARIDAVLSMIRIVERTEQFRRAPKGDEANEKTRSDDEFARLLARVDARIVELARCHAERLGRGEHDGGGG
jgi:hypothetical protein